MCRTMDCVSVERKAVYHSASLFVLALYCTVASFSVNLNWHQMASVWLTVSPNL